MHSASPRCMAHRLDIVPIQIQHEGSVVIRVIVRPQSWRAVVSSGGVQSRPVESIDGRSVLGCDGDGDSPVEAPFCSNPIIGLSVGSEAWRRARHSHFAALP